MNNTAAPMYVALILISVCMAHPKNVFGDTYFSQYGQSQTNNVNVEPGSHSFQINAIAQFKQTDWYMNGTYMESDLSGFFAIDPQYTQSFSSGTTQIIGYVFANNGAFEESHTWNVAVAEPDLVVDDISVSPVPCVAGESCTITAKLCN
ncbi:MAG: hypothetical protein MI923_21260, partial [Phycisphaerales bacterium]|nr:hypothetical protein [Phycisphaerales bacterium]